MELKDIAAEYANFVVTKRGAISVITGDGASKFAEAVKEELCIEMGIMFLTIDPAECDFANDGKTSHDVVEILQKLADENNIHIVVVINRNHAPMRAYIGAELGNKVTDSTTCRYQEDGKMHIFTTKTRYDKQIDAIV